MTHCGNLRQTSIEMNCLKPAHGLARSSFRNWSENKASHYRQKPHHQKTCEEDQLYAEVIGSKDREKKIGTHRQMNGDAEQDPEREWAWDHCGDPIAF